MSSGCSVVALSVAAITSLVSVALVSVAFSTDNWQNIKVDRDSLENIDQTDVRYFDRTIGIFRVCFPHELKPESSDLYLSPVEEWCSNIDYYIRLLDYGFVPERATYYGEMWFHVSRSAIAAFVLYFMWMGIGCVTGLLGCWRGSGHHLTSTAAILLFASISGGAGMGLWHWSKWLELEKVYDEKLGFFLTWPEFLQNATSFTLGWSYIAAWVGIGLSLISSILFSGAAVCIKQELREIEQEEMLLRMQMTYPGLGGGVMKQPNGMMTPTYDPRASMYSNFYPGGPGGYPVHYDLTQDSTFGGSKHSLNGGHQPEYEPSEKYAGSTRKEMVTAQL